MPATDSVKEPTTPTEQVSANGTPKSKTPLPSSVMDSIRAAATKNLPASEVAPTTGTTTIKDEPAKEPAKTTSAPAAAAKTADAAPAAKPADKAAVTDAPADKPKKDGIAAVREAHERAEARAKELEGSLTATLAEKAEAFKKAADLEAKLKTYDERFTKEYEPQIKQLKEREKEVQEIREQLRLRDYTATPEWHETVEKPIANINDRITRLLKQVAINDPNTGTQRAATVDDFTRIAQIPFLNARENAAKQLFGDGFVAQELTRLSGELEVQLENRKQALSNAHIKSIEYFKKQEELQQAESAKMSTRVRERLNAYLVKPADNDPEELAAMAEGQQLLEQLDKGHSDPEVRADIVAKAAAAGASRKVLELRMDRMAKENAALKEQLKRYQSTEPDVEGSGKGAPEAADEGGDELASPGSRIRPSAVFTHALAKARQVAKGR